MQQQSETWDHVPRSAFHEMRLRAEAAEALLGDAVARTAEEEAMPILRLEPEEGESLLDFANSMFLQQAATGLTVKGTYNGVELTCNEETRVNSQIVQEYASKLRSEAQKETDHRPGVPLDSIATALCIAQRYASIDGAHHKQWLIDQMVRALTGCPTISEARVDANGKPYTFFDYGESARYHAFLHEYDPLGNDPWDEGIAP